MRLVNIKQVFALGLVLFFSSHLFAEQEVRSSFRIQMPKKLAYGNSQLLNNTYKISKKMALENMTFESQYPTWAENIQMDLNLQFSPLKIWNFSQPQNFATTSFNIKINIGKTITEYTEVRESPGSSITIDLKAQCENIPLELDDPSAQLKGSITIFNDGSKIRLELNESQMHWGNQAWKILPFQCEGVKGFDRLAKEEIQKYLKTPDQLQETIYSELKKEIVKLEEDINGTIFKRHHIQESTKNFLISMEPQLLLPHKSNEDFRFDGVTRLRFRNLSLNKQESSSIYFDNPPPPSPHQKGPTFIFPLKIVQPLIKKLFSNGNLVETWWSSELNGFSDFMKSDKQKQYVWPEMLNYNSNSRFKLQAQLIETPQISRIQNIDERIEMHVKSTLVIQMFAPKNGGYVPYVEWRAPFKARVSVQVYQGGLWYRVLRGSQFNWSAKMLPHYIKKYAPKDTKIDAQRIGDSLLESIVGKQYHWKIPDWSVSDKLKYQAIKMFRTETLLWIYWSEP